MSKFFSLFVVGLVFSSVNAWPRFGPLPDAHTYNSFEPEVIPITRDCLKHHNDYRADHGVPNLSYDEEVSSD